MTKSMPSNYVKIILRLKSTIYTVRYRKRNRPNLLMLHFCGKNANTRKFLFQERYLPSYPKVTTLAPSCGNKRFHIQNCNISFKANIISLMNNSYLNLILYILTLKWKNRLSLQILQPVFSICQNLYVVSKYVK